MKNMTFYQPVDHNASLEAKSYVLDVDSGNFEGRL